MGKATRIKQATAREKIAAQQAAARRVERRNKLLITGGSILGVIVIVVAFVVVHALSSPPAAGGGSNSQVKGAKLASIVHQVTTVPAATLDKVGSGTMFAGSISRIKGPALTSGGKPEVLYIGAEYCPYCATERWAMAVALSRFGTFSGIGVIHSSASDQPSYIPTLTFYKSSYTSKYLTFTPVEEQTVSRAPLQAPTAAQQATLTKYDSGGTIPFVDFGNKYLINGASYSYAVLQGKTWSQIAAALHNPSTPIAQGALGTANNITAAICKLTGNKPASACSSPVIQALEAKI